MVADDDAAAADRQPRQGLGERRLELSQLVVHLDPQGLKDACGRVALAANGGRHGGGDHIGQLGGGGERTGPHDGPGDAPGQPPLPVLPEEGRQGRLGEFVDQLTGGRPRRLVHPHVEVAVAAVREAALGQVELR